MQTIEQGAEIILRRWVRAKEGERISVFCDLSGREQAEALLGAALRAGADATLHLIEQGTEQLGTALETEYLQKTISESDTMIGATRNSMLTTKPVAEAVSAGKRYLSLPLSAGTVPMLCRPFLRMPPSAASQMAQPLLAAYSGSSTIRVTTAAGTDLTLSVAGRTALAFTGDFSHSRCDSACFEVTIPPIEDSAEGVFVVDGSLGYIGAPKKPLRLHFHRGRLTKIEDSADGERLRDYVAAFRDEGLNVAGEFGVGLNTLARCTGECYIEDESAFGTFHLGMGRNLTFGGRHDAAGHYDLVGLEPTIHVDGVPVQLLRIDTERMEEDYEDSLYGI